MGRGRTLALCGLVLWLPVPLRLFHTENLPDKLFNILFLAKDDYVQLQNVLVYQ